MSKRHDEKMSTDLAAWRQRVARLCLPQYWPEDAAEIIEANANHVVDDILSRPSQYDLQSLKPRRGNTCAIAVDDLSSLMRHLFRAGFVEAVMMHRRELMAAGDLAHLKRKRKDGGDKGRDGGTRRKDHLAQRIRNKWAEMEAAGEIVTNATVAAAIKKECGRGSVRTVQRAFATDDRKAKAAKRTKR
jgi:hypothetical protein